jgi:hypothetical protein
MFNFIYEFQPNLVMNILRKIFFYFRSVVAVEPKYRILYRPFIWWTQIKRKINGKNPKEAIIRPTTELVIDGFQGSANSFATELFIQSQKHPVELSHHLHSPSQIIEAINLKIPVLLTIREPKGAVISLMSRWPHVSVNQGIRSYIAFYSKLKPYASDLIISDFEQTTKHLDVMINRVNQKFNTNFDAVNVNQFDKKKAIEKKHKTKKTSLRSQIKQKNIAEFEKNINPLLITKANEIYQDFISLCEKQEKKFNLQ